MPIGRENGCVVKLWSSSHANRLFLPIPADRRPRRFVQLFVGLTLYGLAMALQVRGALGVDPWNVLHEGLQRLTGLSFGTILVLVSIGVLLLWIPLRQRPGLGTVANATWVGISADLFLALIPSYDALAVRIPLMLVGILGTGVAAAIYIGAGLGPGPRDGLKTGLHAKGLGSIRLIRTCIELAVLGTGYLLGGGLGVGTVLFALSIGPVIQLVLPWVSIDPVDVRRHRDTPDEAK